MSKENEGNEPKPEVTEKKKESKPKKELTPQEIQKRKKMLVYPSLRPPAERMKSNPTGLTLNYPSLKTKVL